MPFLLLLVLQQFIMVLVLSSKNKSCKKNTSKFETQFETPKMSFEFLGLWNGNSCLFVHQFVWKKTTAGCEKTRLQKSPFPQKNGWCHRKYYAYLKNHWTLQRKIPVLRFQDSYGRYESLIYKIDPCLSDNFEKTPSFFPFGLKYHQASSSFW